ncbi:MAG TPA: type III-B CRISPR module-associated Cmr3 family protein [Trebonia sp.]|jgi:CRISPR type III-B/RAMP module-associated protein Cmr3|nr:type III-B CRISPR module-associated Cmr3 family protein [Trebonia sp.]
MTARWVVLEPLDTVSIRDGRGFDMGLDAAARSALPSPATFAGAIGALYDPTPGLARKDPGAPGTRLPSQVHGPITVRRTSGRWEALLPVPHDVVVSGGKPLRLVAEKGDAPVQHDLDEDVALLLADPGGDSTPGEGHWWDADQLSQYLHDGEVDDFLRFAPWQIERRVGIAREADRTVTEGMFYSTEHLRLAPGVGFAGRCVGGPQRKLDGTVPFGGEGRRAEVHGDVPDIGLPPMPADFPGGRLLLYLVTPAVFPGGSWRPDLGSLPGGHGEGPLSEAELVAAAVGTTRVVTTGSPDRRSGAFGAGWLMWAVPAGAVYYLKFPDEAAARAAAARVHGTTIRQAEDWMRTAGFGLVLTGRWTEG